jgi:polyhydroxyalkanoate synthesis repressor PhaR
MSKTQEPVTIKKYANRRLYNTGTSTYVTLEDLAVMVKEGEDFVVYDAKTGEDITRSVLTQIIFEQESKGTNLLPITFLRQLIRFYGDSMQLLVPRYLEMSVDNFTREQEKFREHMSKTLGGGMNFGVGGAGLHMFEDLVRRNMQMFERAFTMFLPSAQRNAAAGGEAAGENIDELKRQVAEMQKRLDRLADGSDDKDKA